MNNNNTYIHVSPSLSHQFHQSLTKQLVTSPPTALKQPFISRVQRFDSLASNTPGPGSYNPPITEKHTIDFKRKSTDDNLESKKFAWIYDRSRMSFALANSQNKLGPGQYEEVKATKMHSSWAKGQRFDSATKLEALGPGYYDSSIKQQQGQRQQSVFKCKSRKTFIQEMIIKTQKQLQQNSNSPQQNQRQVQEVIKFDQSEYPVKQKIVNKNSPVFLSKAKRPDIILESASIHLGPGLYEVQPQSTSYSPRNKGLISAIHYNPSPIKTLTENKRLPPGPGSYQLTNTKLQKIAKKQPLGIIFKQQRFKAYSLTNSQIPGPGQYNQNRFTMLKEDEIILKNKGTFVKKPQLTHNFGKAARTTLRKKIDVPFGQYNVKNFDIEYRIQKQKQHYDKLRLMEVTLPAFNSKHHV